MKISEYNKNAIKNQILEDLYDTAEKALVVRQGDIAKRNHVYEIDPYREVINALPIDILSHAQQYRVQINYKKEVETGKYSLSETWNYQYDKPVICMVSAATTRYGTVISVTGKLDPRLHTDTAALAEDLIALRKEKEDLTKFLEETLEQWSGPKQLRTVWPESLHKYLPELKSRAPKTTTTTKPAKPVAAIAPTTLGTRLTTNLLEGE